MAQPTLEIITALRKTANQLANGFRYEWGNMGSCNCGNLAQTVTTFSRAEIQKFALEKRGDWSEQLVDYCPTSGLPMDLIIEKMIDFGFSKNDLRNLEWLADTSVLARLEKGRYLNRNNRQDTIVYLETWANMLEDSWLESVKLPNLEEVIA